MSTDKEFKIEFFKVIFVKIIILLKISNLSIIIFKERGNR